MLCIIRQLKALQEEEGVCENDSNKFSGKKKLQRITHIINGFGVFS
jgi:hypothetical protein